MSLLAYKGLIAILIAIITLSAGFVSLRLIRNYQHLLALGDAFADGIFLGAAVFHLFPDALEQGLSLAMAILITLAGFLLLFCLERWIIRREMKRLTDTNPGVCRASQWMLVGILSIHAFITGIAVGISESTASILVLFIAILAHKGFESFALMMSLHRGFNNEKQMKSILWAFTFVTPISILLPAFINSFLKLPHQELWTGVFNAFAAGSFLYIGTLHSTHSHFHAPRNRINRSAKLTATIVGIAGMGIVAIWI